MKSQVLMLCEVIFIMSLQGNFEIVFFLASEGLKPWGFIESIVRPIYTIHAIFPVILMRLCIQNLPQSTPHGFLVA